ncbi:MAG: hypothetical protein ACKPKO_49355, partial [Candidatus Fonsibacter sp.]
EEESTFIFMTPKTDNLGAIVWQLYDGGFRPNTKYGATMLSWVSLAVSNHTFLNDSADDRLGY